MTRWGIDPSTLRVAIAVAAPGPAVLCVRERSFEQMGAGKTEQRLLRAVVACQETMRELVEEHGRPDLVVWERPFGGSASKRSVSIESHFIIAAILIAGASVCGAMTRFVDLAPNSWKAKCGASGRATPAEYRAWALELLPGSVLTEDEAAAVGLAVAALTLS